jgi:hypothetical protein
MNATPNDTKEPEPRPSRDQGNWAPATQRLTVAPTTAGAAELVQGRRLQGPLQGFGQMWQKSFRVDLTGATVTPEHVIREWKANFGSFWPRGNRFSAPLIGLGPGEVALINLAAGPMSLSTGVMVLYADETSFTLMTPQGHPYAGWITFSSFDDKEATVAQIQLMVRAQDPLSEVGMMVGGNRAENRFWEQTITAVASHFGVETKPRTVITCVDPSRKWGQAGNVWHNAGIRTVLYQAGFPIRLLKKPFSKPRGS